MGTTVDKVILISIFKSIRVRPVLHEYLKSNPLLFDSRHHIIWIPNPMGGLRSQNAVRILSVRTMAHGHLDFLGECFHRQIISIHIL